MNARARQLAQARALSLADYDRDRLTAHLTEEVAGYRLGRDGRYRMLRMTVATLDVLDTLPGRSLAHRWSVFEDRIWPGWRRGDGDRPGGEVWTWGAWALVISRLVRPSWTFISSTRTTQWVARLPAEDPLTLAHRQLRTAADELTFGTAVFRSLAVNRGLRLLLLTGVDELTALTDADLLTAGPSKGADLLDAMLCQLGALERTPRQGNTRRLTVERHSPAELAAVHGVPAPFTDVVGLYLEHYARRLSDKYATLRHKAGALGHFFTYLRAHHPEVTSCAQVTPAQASGFVEHALELARTLRRGRRGNDGDTTTAHSWLVDVRTFFADVATWGSEDDSPFAAHRPAVIPVTRHVLRDDGFTAARRRRDARQTRTVLDLEREMPNIRAFALRGWHEAQQALATGGGEQQTLRREERLAFWDWAFLELLLTSGLRIEEACELTTFDVLKRSLPDGRLYYLLHVTTCCTSNRRSSTAPG